MTPVGVPELNKNFYSLLKLLSQKEIFCDFFFGILEVSAIQCIS